MLVGNEKEHQKGQKEQRKEKEITTRLLFACLHIFCLRQTAEVAAKGCIVSYRSAQDAARMSWQASIRHSRGKVSEL